MSHENLHPGHRTHSPRHHCQLCNKAQSSLTVKAITRSRNPQGHSCPFHFHHVHHKLLKIIIFPSNNTIFLVVFGNGTPFVHKRSSTTHAQAPMRLLSRTDATSTTTAFSPTFYSRVIDTVHNRNDDGQCGSITISQF